MHTAEPFTCPVVCVSGANTHQVCMLNQFTKARLAFAWQENCVCLDSLSCVSALDSNAYCPAGTARTAGSSLARLHTGSAWLPDDLGS